MNVFLLHRDHDLVVKRELQDTIFAAMVDGNPFALANAKRSLEREGQTSSLGGDESLARDLELETVWSAMAGGDEFLYETAKRVLLSSLSDPEAIVYRQQVLADCLANSGVVRDLYRLALEALESHRNAGGSPWSGDRPDRILARSVQVLRLQLEALRKLRRIADENESSFRSQGFERFFATIASELADGYLAEVERHLQELAFERGLLESARLGSGLAGRDYLVHRHREPGWKARLPFGSRSPTYGFTIPPRDEGGFQALDEIRERGINRVANAVAQSADHIKSFFALLRLELAFYLGCLNLRERLDESDHPVCFPEPVAPGEPALAGKGVYDVSLALALGAGVVGNDVDADGKTLIVITGANQGGKSTFLRALGLAQLMLQSGMFVGARSFRADLSRGVFTHYKREEDATMERGKLDEELARMSQIADRITPGSILLCNESFASTNEREGSEIARQVVHAMLDRRIKVFLVTHMYDLAHGFHARRLENALFLRAERLPDGRRSFELREAEPLPTSYGRDSFRRIFGPGSAPGAVASSR